MLQLPQEAATKLNEVEARIRSLREEKARARKVLEAAKESVEAAPEGQDRAQFEAFKAAKEAISTIDAELEKVGEEQKNLLRQAAGPLGFSGVDGWRDVARHLSIERGEFRAVVPLGALMRPMAALNAPGDGGGAGSSSVSTVRGPFVGQPVDRRFIYPLFPRESLDVGTLAVVDFRQAGGTGTVSGDVVRDPVSIEPKAELDLGITAESEDVEQFAIVLNAVPRVLFDAETALKAFLQSRMQYVLDLALDTHVMGQIAASAPPSGQEGDGLIEQVRNGVAAHRGLGAWPTWLAINPDDAATLDLHTASGSGEFTFATRDAGTASPLWSLQIVESPSVTNPVLLDPGLLGALYAGVGTLTIDPYTGMSTNTVRLRLEVQALLAIRSLVGAYAIQ